MKSRQHPLPARSPQRFLYGVRCPFPVISYDTDVLLSPNAPETQGKTVQYTVKCITFMLFSCKNKRISFFRQYYFTIMIIS